MVKRLKEWWEDVTYEYASEILRSELAEGLWFERRYHRLVNDIDRLKQQVSYLKSSAEYAEKENERLRKKLKKAQK